MEYPSIFSPLTVKSMTVKNRIAMLPMGSNMGGEFGNITDDHIRYYEQRAKGGTGLIIVENACVYKQGLNGTTQIRIDKDRYIPGFSRLVERIHSYGACASLQINHAGAGAIPERTGMESLSASCEPNKAGGPIPRPMTKDEIMHAVKCFGDAAARAVAAGFDAVEVHCGHSYLISQFTSPIYNKRDDEFGGSIENRARMGRLVLQEVRRRVGKNFPVGIRITSDDMVAGGNTFKDTLEILKYWDEYVDVYNVSIALNCTIQYQLDLMHFEDGWRTGYAKKVKETFGKPVIAMGNIRTPELAEKLIHDGVTDFIGMGRGLIAEPQWVNKVASGREDCLRKCISCNIGCIGNRLANNVGIHCTINPDLIHNDEYKEKKVSRPTNVVVVGGGTAGLEAVCTAAEVGCTSFLLEKSAELGGLARKISTFPEKSRIRQFVDYQTHRAAGLHNLFVFTEADCSVEAVKKLHPDVVINATGSAPLLPPIKGLKERVDAENGKVLTALYIIAHMDEFTAMDLTGKNVTVVGGGLVGVDVAEFFARRNAKVTMVEMADEIGRELDPINRCAFKELAEQKNIRLLTGTKLLEVKDGSFIVDTGAETQELDFDYGMVCMGMAPVRTLDEPLREYCLENGIEYANIGDSKKTRKIINGVQEGRNVLKILEKMEILH